MVEEAKEGGGEEAGGDPPREEREETPEKERTEDGLQAPQGDGELGGGSPRCRLHHRGRCWRFSRHRVHLMCARQLFVNTETPRVATWHQEGTSYINGGFKGRVRFFKLNILFLFILFHCVLELTTKSAAFWG